MGKHGPSRVDPIIEATIRAMREDCGVKKLGGVGYCLGAKYVCQYLAKGKGVEAGFIAHPSATTEDEIRAINGALSIAAAGQSTITNSLMDSNVDLKLMKQKSIISFLRINATRRRKF